MQKIRNQPCLPPLNSRPVPFLPVRNQIIIFAIPDYETRSSYDLKFSVWDGLFENTAAIGIKINDIEKFTELPQPDRRIRIFPNPFTDFTTISLSDVGKIRRIELMDLFGRNVRIMDNLGSNSVTIHRKNLPGGTYFIRIHADELYVRKVMIE